MRRTAVLLLAPLLVVAAACGGDDDDDTSARADASASVSGDGSFCAEAEALQQRFDDIDGSLGGDSFPDADTFDEAAKAIEDLADDAPAEIRADLEVVAGAVGRFAEVFAGIDLSDPNAFTDPEVVAELEAAGKEMEELGTEMEESSERVEAYLEDECGLEIDDDADTEVDAEVRAEE